MISRLLGTGCKWLWRLGKALLLLLLLLILLIWLVVARSGDDKFDYNFKDDWVENITQINGVRVAREIQPTSVAEIVEAIQSTTGPISIGGGRYSQGGQVAYPDSLHIDMRKMNQVLAFDKDNKEITLQAGIRWRDIQEYIDPYNLSIKIMQTYANFTLGGSLSVNVHGRYVGEGPLVNSVKRIKLVLANGEVKEASPRENPELFYGVIGGYGGLGVIVEATLALEDNIKVERRDQLMPIGNYKNFFFANIRNQPEAVFTNGDIYPPDYDQVRSITWYKSNKELTDTDRLIPRDGEYFWGPKVVDLIASGSTGLWLRQHLIDPVIYLGSPVVWRNHEASYDVCELEPASRKDTTYALREYFIPVEKFDAFVPQMRDIFNRNQVDVINVSIRHAKQDPGTLLAWAKSESFAFVVYYRQGTSRADQAKVKTWTREMNQAAIDQGGAYYLPYQIFETRAQFAAAYPRAQEYFALKKALDPTNRLRNQLWAKLYAEDDQAFDKDAISQYYRGEEQTFLTLPEWYLVFNPQEYADYLAAGKAPGEFPFWQSIDEYWRLYDRVRVLSRDHYPPNDEYITMLRVIGISTTLEYMLKGAYEKTIGRFTWWLADHQATPEDELIARAQAAYAQLIYDQAWYKFDFKTWVDAIWRDTSFWGPHFARKLERKLFFSAEFGFKTLYAKLIAKAVSSNYEPSDGYIYLTAKAAPGLSLPAPARLLEQQGDNYLIALPRWGEFTRNLPKLLALGLVPQDISGNKRIALSLLGSGAPNVAKEYHLLFSSPLVSDASRQRAYVYTQVSDLQASLESLAAQGFSLEHIYDY